MKKYFLIAYILATALIFLLRVCFFANQFGGVEHDSGWFLGVTRNLAQRGIYASYTNTVVQEEKGSYPSIHGRFSVQDNNGFSYFPAGVTVGPGYVVPEAILLKIFGYGFWQYRLWPLISFFGLLILLFYFTQKLGGWISLLILQIWLWIFPQIYISLAYEAYGEHIALFYLLLSFFLLKKSYESKKHKYIITFSSGLIFSLSFLTKYLSLMNLVPLGVIFLFDLYSAFRGKTMKERLVVWFIWGMAFVLPIIVYESYRYMTLVYKFGIEGWKAINADIRLHFKSNGSGLALNQIKLDFVLKKMSVWSKVGLKYPLLSWLSLFVLSVFVIKDRFDKNIKILLLVFTSSIVGLVWFIFLSPTGWTRHAWMGLVLGFLLIVSCLGRTLDNVKGKGRIILILSGIFIFTPIVNLSYPNFLFTGEVVDKWERQRYEGGLQGLPTNTIASLSDQKELKIFFDKNIQNQDRIYYLGWFLVAEASPIVDKVFYSYDRYEYLNRKNPEGGKSYLILGPYQQGRLSLVGPLYSSLKVNSLCSDVVFTNDSYTLCSLRNDIDYVNRAYD